MSWRVAPLWVYAFDQPPQELAWGQEPYRDHYAIAVRDAPTFHGGVSFASDHRAFFEGAFYADDYLPNLANVANALAAKLQPLQREIESNVSAAQDFKTLSSDAIAAAMAAIEAAQSGDRAAYDAQLAVAQDKAANALSIANRFANMEGATDDVKAQAENANGALSRILGAARDAAALFARSVADQSGVPSLMPAANASPSLAPSDEAAQAIATVRAASPALWILAAAFAALTVTK